MGKRATSVDGVEARMASTWARRATTPGIRLPSQSHMSNSGPTGRVAVWRGVDAAPAPSPGHCSRYHRGALPERVAALTHQSGAATSIALHVPLLACGDRHLVRVQA